MKQLLCALALAVPTLCAAQSLHDAARAPAPAVLSVERLPETSGIDVQHVVFRSLEVNGVPNEVHAVLAAPRGNGPYPALLILHHGRSAAQGAMAEEWARRGYVAITPDLPGIADPKLAARSGGVWTTRPYGADRWTVAPTIANSTIYQSLAAGIGAVRLLQAMKNVDTQRIGIIGASWGAYATTVLAGALGGEIRAAYSVWGGGYFEDTVFANDLARLSAPDRERWQAALGAEQFIPGIRARFFIAGATNDRAFFLPSIVRTFEAIRAPKGIVFGPNADHDAGGYPGGPAADERNWTAQEVTFFEHALKDRGSPLPEVKIASVGAQSAELEVHAELGIRELALYTSEDAASWQKRNWKKAEGRIRPLGGKRFKVDLGDLAPGHWFVIATDVRGVSGSSLPQKK
ncbi:alpha/beta hydrolase family protein [Massilia endophytica]|uniref:alpha/beta hydrolase family protein n=1 Tax=Massilia endophytica TaxID=2899220 RepID=UPI001E4124D3|nr:dienelactone hydrolase family protein [Massilia endophytica]UGQ48485.1 dienelactone hydrolase family protein [Massilia endophytica]